MKQWLLALLYFAENPRKHALNGFIAIVTLYLIVVNSFALFVLYPSLHDHHVVLPYFVYIFLTWPFWVLAVYKLTRLRIDRYIVVGAALFVAALLVRLSSGDHLGLLLGAATIYLMTGYIEEMLWRNILWRAIQLRTGSPKQTYAWVTLHFVVLHIPFAFLRAPSPLPFLASVAALGVILGGVRLATGNVRLPIWLHAAVNLLAKT